MVAIEKRRQKMTGFVFRLSNCNWPVLGNIWKITDCTFQLLSAAFTKVVSFIHKEKNRSSMVRGSPVVMRNVKILLITSCTPTKQKFYCCFLHVIS